MLSRFFIDRPIFAAVISLLITLAGAIALQRLPIAQYPPVAPPTIQIDCNYPGASSAVVSQTVAAPIEQQVNGVENMLYMASQSTNDGSYTLTVTFKPGVNLNLAQVLVQNRVSLALPMLPDVVRQTGVVTKKRAPDILLTVNLSSPSARYDQLYLSNYALLHVRDELARLPGISEVLVFGQRDYSMRVWLNPEILAERNLTVLDVQSALREQNFQPATGQLGQPPSSNGQAWQFPLTTRGRLKTPDEFGEIIPEGGNIEQTNEVPSTLEPPSANSESTSTHVDQNRTARKQNIRSTEARPTREEENNLSEYLSLGMSIKEAREAFKIEIEAAELRFRIRDNQRARQSGSIQTANRTRTGPSTSGRGGLTFN